MGWVEAVDKPELFWSGSDTDVQITLKGSITGDKVAVKETVHNSDYSG